MDYIHVYIHTYMYVRTYVRMYVCMHVCINTRAFSLSFGKTLIVPKFEKKVFRLLCVYVVCDYVCMWCIYVWCVHMVCGVCMWCLCMWCVCVCVFMYVCAHACAISFNAFANQIFLSTFFPWVLTIQRKSMN